MEFDSLFTQEIVREFMLANGGKVTNPVLIGHFKNFLNDPIRKVANRQQFKTYVNTLATVKLDETGTKVLVLKRKFREGYEDSFQTKHTSPQISSEPTPPTLASKPKLDEASSSSELGSTKEEPVASQSIAELPKTSTETSEPLAEERPRASTEELQPRPSDETEIRRDESPQRVAGEEIHEQPSEEMTSDTADTTQEPERTDLNEEVSIEQSNKEDKSISTNVEDSPLISLGLNLSTNYFLGDVDNSEKKGGSFEEVFKSELVRGIEEQTVVDAVTKTSYDTSSHAVKAKTEVDSANKGLKAASSEEKILRVKDAALNIDKLENEKTSQLSKAQLKTKRESRKPLGSDSTSSCDMEPQNMTDVDREWLMKSCKSDYQAMCKLLQMHPHLAPRKDFITGYNALHWACKNGNTDVVKLLCGTYHLDANTRTSGGYTPLHLAAMMDHEEVKELLLKVYKADPAIRDYSGRQMKHYQIVAASKKSMHLVMPRKGTSPTFLVNSAKRTSSQSLRSEKENALPLSPVTRKPFRPDDSILMPPPTKLPPVTRRRPTSASSKTVHSDSETSESQSTLNASANISGSTPNFETVV